MTPRNNHAPERPEGPWLLAIVGTWGTGRHSRHDYDIYVVDLDGPLNGPQSSGDGDVTLAMTFLTEDIEPQVGLAVVLGDQVIRPLEDGTWSVRDA